MTQLRERADENPIEPDDAFIDFATDDFINKNIFPRCIKEEMISFTYHFFCTGASN